MIEVTRGVALEQDNGDLAVSVIVRFADRARFLSIADTPGSTMLLSEFASPATSERPAAQTASPKGIEPVVPGPSSQARPALTPKQAADVKVLCAHPWFQRYAEEALGKTVDGDSVKTAQAWVYREVLDGSGDASARYEQMVTGYVEWCKRTGHV